MKTLNTIAAIIWIAFALLLLVAFPVGVWELVKLVGSR